MDHDSAESLDTTAAAALPRLLSRAALATVVAVATVLLSCVVIASAGVPAALASTAALVSTLLLYVASRQISFEIGLARTTASQVAFVPLWFLVAPAALPLVVVGAEFVARSVSALRTGRQIGPWSTFGLWGVGVRAAGPAAVLAAFAPGVPTLTDSPVYLLAVAAQLLADTLWRAGVRLANPGRRRGGRRGLWVELRSRWALDLALTPVAIIGAVALVDSPWLLWTLAPVPLLLAQFAKERDERMVKANELSLAYRGTAQLMGDVLEADDEYTGGEHTEGVVDMSLAVGRYLGLDDAAMRNLEFGSLLHDIGKLRVPNEIINKPGKLNDEEWAIIKEHPRYGQEMLDRVGGALSEAGAIVRAHHERWDGAGYPDRLAGDAIPIEARIITACDSFSAMTTNRSYRRAMSDAEAVEELERCSGTQFDPAVVEALRAVVAEMPQSKVPSAAPLTAVPSPAAVADAAGEADAAAADAASDGVVDDAQAA